MAAAATSLTRRDWLAAAASAGGATALGLAAGALKFQLGQGIVAGPPGAVPDRAHLALYTPACDAGATTPWVSEGPFYAPATPLRFDLRPPGLGGITLHLAGRVLDAQCRPLRHAVLDVWQTDPTGRYDHFGYEFRGHQFTDAEGRYELLTLLPASYRFLGFWRRRHIHVKVAAPRHRPLTSQVFFPFGEDAGFEDFSFDRRLVCRVLREGSSGVEARFDFVLGAA